MSWNEFNAFESSNIARIKYEDEQCILEVTFHNGGMYHYFDVPSHISNDLEKAESKGKYLAAHIKGKFRYSKV